MSLKRNVIANYVGQGWRAVVGLAFVPLYIKYLGVETYGLIGVFAILQTWLRLLDLGMRPALAREMARFQGGAHTPESIRDLLRSVEFVGFGVAAAIALSVWSGSSWLASDWLHAERVPVDVVAQSLSLMGVVAAFGFIEEIYISSLVGLQRQTLQNGISVIISTLRGLGAVGVLALVSPTPLAFFLWQAVVSIASLVLSATAVYRSLPTPSRAARFSRPALLTIWRFARGMVAITLLSLLLTQVDKLLLSRLLSLEYFGYYALAGVVTAGLTMLVGPIGSAFYPRFTELVTRDDQSALRASYHLSAQLVTVLMGSAATMLIVFGDRIILLWTGDAALTDHVAPLVRVLALGTFLNGLMQMPYQMQLAHGWTSLSVQINVVAVGLIIPAILLVVPIYGAIGGAWIWVMLNAGYVSVAIYLMHRRLLPSEKWRWYLRDIFAPLLGSFLSVSACWSLVPTTGDRVVTIGVMTLASGTAVLAATLSAGELRRRLLHFAR